MSKNTLALRKVTLSDSRFLYELLAERKPNAFIAHKTMPSYDKHVEFVRSFPYFRWYIIKLGTKKLGSISLTKQNEIGIWIKRDVQHRGIGTRALRLLMKKNPNLRYLANINPANKESILFFKKNGFKLIQYTYELTSDVY